MSIYMVKLYGAKDLKFWYQALFQVLCDVAENSTFTGTIFNNILKSKCMFFNILLALGKWIFFCFKLSPVLFSSRWKSYLLFILQYC